MKIIQGNSEDFNPPFGNPEDIEEASDTYQDITVNISAKNVELLSEILSLYISDNMEVLTPEEWTEIEELQNLLDPGIIPAKQ